MPAGAVSARAPRWPRRRARRRVAGAVGLAAARLGGGDRRRRSSSGCPGASGGLRSRRPDDAVRRDRRRARRAVRALGLRLVPRDRRRRLRRRRARGVLPAVSAARAGRRRCRCGSALVGGALASTALLGVALVLLHRLVALDFDRARRAQRGARHGAVSDVVLLLGGLQRVAVPRAVGRRGLRGAARALGAGPACSARSRRRRAAPASLLLVPLAILYLWDGGAAAPARAPPAARGRRCGSALVPLGLVAYCAFLALSGQRRAGAVSRPGGLVSLVRRPVRGRVGRRSSRRATGARQLLSGARDAGLLHAGRRRPVPRRAPQPRAVRAGSCSSLVAVAGALRRLPAAYGAYVVAALALPLSYPVGPQPLMSLPRFVAVLFPLAIWLALWMTGRAVARAARASARSPSRSRSTRGSSRRGTGSRERRMPRRARHARRARRRRRRGSSQQLRRARRRGQRARRPRAALRAEIAYYRAHHDTRRRRGVARAAARALHRGPARRADARRAPRRRRARARAAARRAAGVAALRRRSRTCPTRCGAARGRPSARRRLQLGRLAARHAARDRPATRSSTARSARPRRARASRTPAIFERALALAGGRGRRPALHAGDSRRARRRRGARRRPARGARRAGRRPAGARPRRRAA